MKKYATLKLVVYLFHEDVMTASGALEEKTDVSEWFVS